MKTGFLRGLTVVSNAATATSPLYKFRRVRIVGYDTNGVPKVAYAGASDTDAIGCLRNDVFDTVTPVDVEPFINGQYCGQTMVALDALTPSTSGVACYAAANGKVSASGTVLAGLAISTTTTDGDFVTVLPSAAAILGAVARTGLSADTQPYTIPLSALKTHATLVALGSSAGTPSGDFGLTPGTFGSATPVVIGEAASGNVKTDYCRFLFEVPPEYVAAGNITLRIHAKMTGALTVGATIGAAAYKSDSAAGVGSNLIATAAQALTTSFADYDFVITGTTLVPGDVVDIQITGIATDTGGTTGYLINIGDVRLRASIKG